MAPRHRRTSQWPPRPRDFKELIQWVSELSWAPYSISSDAQNTESLWSHYRHETRILDINEKWIVLISYFWNLLITNATLMRPSYIQTTMRMDRPCSGENKILNEGLTLKNIALCRFSNP